MPIKNLTKYRDDLERRLNPARGALNVIYDRARSSSMRIVFSEGDNSRVLQAASTIIREGIATPILLGNETVIQEKIKELKLDLGDVEIIDPITATDTHELAVEFAKMRERKGITLVEAKHLLRSRNYYAAMFVRKGKADGMLSGVTRPYPNAIKPVLQCIGVQSKKRAMGMYVIASRTDIKFLCDTTLNIEPDAEALAQIAISTADRVKSDFGVIPRIAMLSFSNFGSVDHPSCTKAALATKLVKTLRPDLEIDGEMQADIALNDDKRKEHFPFSTLTQNANVLIFSNLESANIAYKLLEQLGPIESIGPILIGLNGAANVCQLHSNVKDIVHMCAVTAAHARDLKASS